MPTRMDSVKAVEAKRGAKAAADAPNFQPVDPAILKETFLSEVRKAKKFFFGTVVAQAQKIDFEGDKVVFTFGPQHRALRAQLEQNRLWLESAASQLAGRRVGVVAAEGGAASGPPSLAAGSAAPTAASFGGTPSAAGAAAIGPDVDRKQDLKERALTDAGVQNMLDVFAAEIKDVEEM